MASDRERAPIGIASCRVIPGPLSNANPAHPHAGASSLLNPARSQHLFVLKFGKWTAVGIMHLVGATHHRGLTMATLHLMVGLPCSGKTTLAVTLEREHSAIRLTLDEWHLRLFGQDAEDPEHNARHSLIESLLWDVASRALALGTNVILDFGFWAREEREDFRSRAKQLGASSEVHFLDVPPDELLRRLAQRNAQLSKFSFKIPCGQSGRAAAKA
jgi:predicted kinase